MGGTMRLLVISLIVVSCGASAQSVFKCRNPNGGVSFQQTPCQGAQRAEAATASANGANDAAPSGASGSTIRRHGYGNDIDRARAAGNITPQTGAENAGQ